MPWYSWVALAALVYLVYATWRHRTLAAAGAAQVRGQFDLAVRRLRSFLASPLLPFAGTTKPFARTQLAGTLHDMGRLGEAEGEVRAALEQARSGPTAVMAHLLLADILTARDHLDEAAIEARKALALCQRGPLPTRSRMRALCDMQGALAHAALAQIHLRRGDLDLARADAADALQRDPGCLSALVLLGDVARRQGEFDEAIDLYAKLVPLDESAPAPLPARAAVAGLGIGLALADKGDYAGAAERLSQVLGVAAGNPALQAVTALSLASSLAAMGKNEEAGRVLAEAEPRLEALGENRELRAYELYHKGLVHRRAGEYEQAVRDLTSAAETASGPNLLPEIYFALGETFRESGDAARAREAYGKAAGVLPSGHYSERAKERLAEMT